MSASSDLDEEPWEFALRSYLDLVDPTYKRYHTDAEFHYVCYWGAHVVTHLLALHPEGPPKDGLEHIARRLRYTAQAAIVEHRGQFEAEKLLADGWTWAEGEEHVSGKRLRWMIPPPSAKSVSAESVLDLTSTPARSTPAP